MIMDRYVGRLLDAEAQLADALRMVAKRHVNAYEIREMAGQLAEWSDAHVTALRPLAERIGVAQDGTVRRLRAALFRGPRTGAAGLLHDLEDLSVLANLVTTYHTILIQGAKAIKDVELEATCTAFIEQTNRQSEWICAQIKLRAPQTLLVPPDRSGELRAARPRKPNVALLRN